MSHLSYEQRYSIEVLLKSGTSQNKIAEIIAVDKSVVCREIRRNCDARNGAYRASLAQKNYEKRLFNKPKSVKLTSELESTVRAYIEDDYSPEQVCGVLKKAGCAWVSHETIYKLIWKEKKQGGDLHTHLRTKGRRYRKRGASKDSRGIIKNRTSIEQRPEIVDKRSRFGDLEVDLIIGKNHNQAILTINDRASGMLKMCKIASKQADVVTQSITDLLAEWKPYLHTITADNGKEFAGHEQVAESLAIDYFFARPYHSWERGSNENLNGLIRQYFTKGSDFTGITDQRIKEVETKLNNRPRKRHGYENPIFVMEKLLFNPEVAFVA